MKFTEDRRKILKVATMYYEEGYTQAEIAVKIGISRPVISKLLREARELGIVEIYIKDENACSVQLAFQIEQQYNLHDVIVVPTAREFSGNMVKKSVTRAAASYLSNQLTEITSLGLSWGTTIAEVIDEMAYLPSPMLTIHPLVGGVASRHLAIDANHLAFLLSEKLSASCQYLYAPALAESRELKVILEHSDLTSTVLEQAKKVDLAVIGVGNPTNSTTWEDLAYIHQTDLQQLKELGVVGDAVASFFDKNGQMLQTDLTERLMGVTIEELKAVRNVVAVASGKEKSDSIRALLLAGVLNTLIIDQEIAEKICQNKV